MNEKYNVLVTYDIEQYHTQVRKRLIENFGFEEVMIGDNNTKCYLPNTTLFKKNLEMTEILSNFEKLKIRRAQVWLFDKFNYF